MAEDHAEGKQTKIDQARRRGKPAASKKRKGRLTLRDLFPEEGVLISYLSTDTQVDTGKPKADVERALIFSLLEAAESEADVEQEITTALRECVTAVAEAHEQMQSNRGEIEWLGEETRRLL